MVFGLPGTSFPEQMELAQPLTVMVPEKFPGVDGGSGVIVIWPVFGPVITSGEWLKPLPDCVVAMKTVPKLTVMSTVWGAGAEPPWVAENVTELVESE